MLDHIQIENLVFLDIETVPQSESFDLLGSEAQKLWEKKSEFMRKDGDNAADVYHRAGIYAEFGKIICISAGLVYNEEGKKKIRIKSFTGTDERIILQDFAAMLKNLSTKKNYSLCAHNGKEFDFPYISRRMLIHGMELPGILDVAGKKPWEVSHVDTLELWKFGDFKNYTSLDLLAHIFGLPSPKDDIDGSMVAEIYYKTGDLPRITKYCEKDVITVIRLILKFKGLPVIPDEDISIA
jgi:predicted PolB exonuclease-like 3'-5' exonuclease